MQTGDGRLTINHGSWGRKLAGAIVFTVFGTGIFAHSALAQTPQNPDFNVTVNTGPTPPNADTVYPGQPTSLRITLSNNSTVQPLTNVNFAKPLPGGTAGLLVSGATTISGAGCSGGSLVTAVGQAGISLANLTVPVLDENVAGSGECYLDIPIVAYSITGASTSLSYALNAGEVGSDQGFNATGGPQAITLRPVARPTWSKTVVGGQVVTLGGTAKILRITVQNPDSNVGLTDIRFSDPMPASGAAGAIIEPTGAAATGSCVTSQGAVVALTGGAAASIGVTGLDLPPLASCSIDVPVQARHTGGNYDVTVANRIPAVGFTSDQGLRPASDAVTNVTARSPLAVGKAFAPGIIASGAPSTFSITLTNAGSSALAITRFRDNPVGVDGSNVPGLSVASAAAVTLAGSCQLPATAVALLDGAGSPTATNGTGFEISDFTIPANSNCTISVAFTGVTPASDEPTTYTNQIVQGAVVVTGQPGIISQARSATVIVADRLRVLKSATPATTAPGNPVRYQVTVQNFSNAALAGVTVADTLQNGATLLTGPGFAPQLTAACGALGLNGRVQGDSDLLFTIPTVPARSGVAAPGQCTISFSVMTGPDSTGNTTNRIAADAVCIGGLPSACNRGASNQVSTASQPVLVFDKTFNGQSALSLSEGQPARLRLRLRNYSVSPLATVTFSDTLPSAGPFQQLRIASPANINTTCGGSVTAVPGQTSLALNGGTIAALSGTTPGACQVEVDVVGPAGVYPNTADAAAEQALADGTVRTVNATDDATLTYSDILGLAKSFSPTEVGPGGRSTVRVAFTNLDNQRPISGIGVTDALPAGLQVANPGNAYTTCAGAAAISAPAGGSTVSMSGATLAPAANCALLFDVVVSGNGSPNWVNSIAPGQITADGGLTNRDPVTATLFYLEPPVPLISKAIIPGAIVPGQSALLAISITNGSEAVSNLSVTDYFTVDGQAGSVANGMLVAPDPRGQTNCPGGVVVASPGGSSMAVSGVNLAADEVCRVEVMVTSTRVGTITNTIPLGSISSAQGATNSTTFAQSTLSTTSSLGISKQFTPAVVSPNEPARLRVTFFNALEGSLTNFSITDNYPPGLVSAAVPAPFSNCGGSVNVVPAAGSVTLTGGNLGPAVGGQAASCYLEVNVVAADEDAYLNTIGANSLLVNGSPATHPSADATLEVRQRLILNKAIDGRTLDPGDPVGFTTGTASRRPGVVATMTIRLENPNEIPVTRVAFRDALPDGLFIAGAPNLLTDCPDAAVVAAPYARQLELTGATLAAAGSAGGICTVQVDVASNLPGIYTNEIPGEAVSSFENITNLLPTQAQVIISEPGTVAKDFAPPVVAPAVASVLSLIIGNDNELDMVLSAPLVDNLPAFPAQMTVADPNNVATTCPGGVGTIVSAAPGATTVQLNSGTVIPPGGCVVTVDVTAPTPGSYDNNIPVGAMQTNFGPSETPATAGLVVSTRGYIAGKVFLDNQAVPDGLYIGGQSTTIPGNTVQLHRAAACNDPNPVVLQTDGQGNYLFADLAAGTYSVCQPGQPAGTLNSVVTAGSIASYNGSGGTPGTASNPPGGNPSSQILGIVLSDNGNADEVSGSPDNNFSEVLPATLAGNVYYDRNNNGIFDAGDSGIAGVPVQLTGPVSLSTITAAGGSYSFSGLPPGSYTVRESQPPGWTDGMESAGSNGGNTGVNDVISGIALAPGDAATAYNFAEILVAGTLNVQADGSCRNDLPYASYDVSTFEAFAGVSAPRVTVTWLTTAGRIVQVLTDQPVTGSLLWPGAAVDGAGNGVAWPGWEVVGGEWLQVPDDRVPDMILRVSINSDAEAGVVYPQATPTCQAQPTGTYRAQAIPVTPRWALALLMVLTLATALLVLYRRRAGLAA